MVIDYESTSAINYLVRSRVLAGICRLTFMSAWLDYWELWARGAAGML